MRALWVFVGLQREYGDGDVSELSAEDAGRGVGGILLCVSLIGIVLCYRGLSVQVWKADDASNPQRTTQRLPVLEPQPRPAVRSVLDGRIRNSEPGGRQIMSRKYHDKDWLREKYVDEELSTYDIAEECGVAGTTIRDWLSKYDIDTRAANGSLTRREYANYRMDKNGYMQWESSHRLSSGRDRKHKTIRVHQLLAIAGGANPHTLFGKDSGNVVHHENGVRWDNRLDNIQIMGRAKHTSKHWETRKSIERDKEGRYRAGFETPNPQPPEDT